MVKIVKIEPVRINVTDSQSTEEEYIDKGTCFVHFVIVPSFYSEAQYTIEGKIELRGTKEELENKDLKSLILSFVHIQKYEDLYFNSLAN